MPKVKCEDCGFYKFDEDIGTEPKGGCENDAVLFDVCMLDYNGRNWRLNNRNSDTPRYCKGFKNRLTKETKEEYFYAFPQDGKFYVIRWLGSGGYHLYPRANGKIPEGFKTREKAEKYLRELYADGSAKVIDAIEASKFPVPKRW